jgi:hypothetical protein
MATQATLTLPQAAESTTSSVYDCGQGVTREWLYDKRILVVTRSTTTRESVDVWFNVLKQSHEEWPSDKVYLLLSDFSAGYAHSPYVTARTKELAALPRKGYMIYTAVVLPKSFTLSLVAMIMNSVQHLRRRDLYVRLFFDRAEALAWLKTCMDRIEAGTLPRMMQVVKR